MKTIKVVICICVMAFALVSVAQEKPYIPFNQVRFSSTAAMYDNLRIVNTSGADNVFKSKPCFGMDVTVSYYQNIVKWFGMSLGVGVSSAPYNTSFEFTPKLNDPTTNDLYANGIKDSRYNPQGMLTVPLAVSMLIPTKNRSWLCNIELGAKCNVPLSEQNGTVYYGDFREPIWDIEVIKEQSLAWIECSSNKSVLFSYFVKVGFSKLMKRNNSWNLSLVANYSPQKLGKGSYELKTIDGNITGTFEQNMNFIGIEVAYGLTLCKKKGLPKDM